MVVRVKVQNSELQAASKVDRKEIGKKIGLTLPHD